jgi:hypothetical protein
MPSPQRAQICVAERLHAQADAGHARGAQRCPIRRLATARVGLEGDLGEVDARPSVQCGRDHAPDLLGAHERRGAAAEGDRAQRAGRRPDRQLGEQRIGVARQVVGAPADRHEVAVRAHQPAERHVNVEMVWRPVHDEIVHKPLAPAPSPDTFQTNEFP